jgi:glycosyltransferase involved in cell wall biosynthesis
VSGESFPPPRSVPVSVLIPTRDEAAQIADCLATLGWAREVAVVDSESTDGTREIAAATGAAVWTRRFDRWGAQKNWALAQLAHPWALCVDADERATPALARSVARAVGERGDAPAPAGYRIERANHFMGRRIRRAGWGGERIVRLFRRDRGRFDDRLVHEQVVLDGPPADLAGALHHEPYRSWRQIEDKLARYARAGALEAYARGRRAGALDVLLRPPIRFLRMYVAQGGALEGAPGAVLCGLGAASVYWKYAMLWDLGRRGEAALDDRAAAREARAPDGRG